MAKDYYQILGVSKGASPEEIKKAYYKMAHQHHPHKGGDETKMKEVNEAYGVLGNPEKKSQYDQYGQTFEQAKSQGGFSGAGDFSDFAKNFGGQNGNNFSFEFGDIGDIFGDFFGGGGAKNRRRSKSRGADLEVELTLDFTQAAFGTEKELKINKDTACQVCNASGAEPGSKVTNCQTCGGSGQVVRNLGFGLGFPSVCPDCQGVGKKNEKECHHCRGQGVTKETETIKVKIPAGIDNNQTIRLADRGMAGTKGAPAGDLYLRIKVLPHPFLTRAGYDIKTKAEISFSQAALGDKIEIEALDGKLTLKIPEGTQSGKIFRLKDRGVPHLQSRGRGDHLVELIVKTPTRLSRRQRDLLKELENEI